MSCQDKVMLQLDPEYRQLIKDLVIEYLSDNPTDFVGYACEFFRNKIQIREANRLNRMLPSDLEDEEDGFRSCRGSVRGESFNPEECEDFTPQIYPKTNEEKDKIKKTLEQIMFFRLLDEKDKCDMIDAMVQKTVINGDVIIQEGDIGDFFYIIGDGTFEAFKSTNEGNEVVKTYHDEGYFGELALLHNTPRAMNVKAKTDGILWKLDRLTFRKLVLKSNYKRLTENVNFLKSVPILSSLSLEERFTLAECLVSQVYHHGEQIIAEGEVGDGMYFLVNGRAKIVTTPSEFGEKENVLKIVTQGDYFGELALIKKEPRAASVYAIGDVDVVFLPLDLFERLLGPCIEVMKRNIEEYDKQLHLVLSNSLSTKKESILKRESIRGSTSSYYN